MREITPVQSSLLACLEEKTWPPSETHASALDKELRHESHWREKAGREEDKGKGLRGGKRKKDVYVYMLEGGGEFEIFFRTADVFITFNQQNIPNPCAGHQPPTLWHERAPQFGQHFEGGPRNAAAMRRGRFGFWRVSTELTSRPWPRCCLPRELLHRFKRSFGQSRASLREEEGAGRTAADCVNRKTNSF